jgi:hypothetical protein
LGETLSAHLLNGYSGGLFKPDYQSWNTWTDGYVIQTKKIGKTKDCFRYKLIKTIFGIIKRQDFYINKKLKDEKIYFNNGLPDPFHVDIL